MESNTTSQQYFNDAMPLAEPHFEEEATLLSARPVVPLEEIKAEARSGKRLVFVVVIALSLVVGALGGTLIYKHRVQGQSTAVTSTAIPGAAGIAFDEPAPAIVEGIEGAAAEALPQAGTASVRRKPVPRVGPRAELPRVTSERNNIFPQPVDERELSRAERIDARRLRRRSEREAWRDANGRRRKSDDLLRIREIFEGPSKP